jgi:hypothetical protein
MLFFALLLLEFSLFSLHDFEIGLPSSLAMEYHLPRCIYAVCYFREGVIAASTAYPYFLIADPIFFPTKVALVNEPSNAADLSAV